VATGDGVLTISDGTWAYCTAGLLEPHHWVQVEPMDLYAIDHSAVAELFEGRP